MEKKEFCRKHVECKEKLLVLKKKMPCSSLLSLATMSKAPFVAFSFWKKFVPRIFGIRSLGMALDNRCCVLRKSI